MEMAAPREQVARDDGGPLLAAHGNGDRRRLSQAGPAVPAAGLRVPFPLRRSRARPRRSLPGDFRSGAPTGADLRSVPPASSLALHRGRERGAELLSQAEAPSLHFRRTASGGHERRCARRRGPRFGAGDDRLARAGDPGSSSFPARGTGPRDAREPSFERHRVHSRASRQHREDAPSARSAPVDGKLRPTHESDIMSEICERLREEAALLGRAPETEDLKEHAAACAECGEFLSKLTALENDLCGASVPGCLGRARREGLGEARAAFPTERPLARLGPGDGIRREPRVRATNRTLSGTEVVLERARGYERSRARPRSTPDAGPRP